MSIPTTTGIGLSLRGMTKSTRPSPKTAARPLRPGVLSVPGTPRAPSTPSSALIPSGSLDIEDDVTILPGTGRIGEEYAGEEFEEFEPTEQRITTVQTSRNVVTSAQEKLEEFPATFTELALMPMACYSCGKIVRQLAIEDALRSGKTIAQVMNEMRYQRLCCRNTVTTAPSIIKLQKELEQASRFDIEQLGLEETDIGTVSSFGLGGFIRPMNEGELSLIEEGNQQLVIVDEAPTGTITGPGTPGAFSFTGQGESLVQIEPVAESSYDIFMAEINDDGES